MKFKAFSKRKSPKERGEFGKYRPCPLAEMKRFGQYGGGWFYEVCLIVADISRCGSAGISSAR